MSNDSGRNRANPKDMFASGQMLAAKKTGPGQAALITVPLPELQPGDVLVKVRACAICASDFPFWKAEVGDETPRGHPSPDNPGLNGHEIAGDIAAVAPGVPSDLIGDRVWIDVLVGCGVCEWCLRQEVTCCERLKIETRGFAEYVVAPVTNCHPIPDGMDYVTASMLCDMAGTPFSALKKAALTGGEKVGVWGLGPVGLGLVQWARVAGAGEIVGIDPVPFRRHFAERIGATRAVAPEDGDAPRYYDVVLCSVSNEAAVAQAFESLRLGGRMVAVAGFTRAGGGIAKWVCGSFGCDPVHWDEMLDHIAAGRFSFEGYATHTFPLEDIEVAFDIRINDPDGSLKVVITPD